MLILLLKADQLGLFDKLVPVKASVRSDGTVVAPHMAHRHVRPAEPAHAHVAAHGDLFDQKPASKPVAKPKKSATLDLFEDVHEPDASEKRVQISDKAGHDPDKGHEPNVTQNEVTTPKNVPEREQSAPVEPEKPANIPSGSIGPDEPEKSAAATVGKIDYQKPFDPAKVPAFGVPVGTSKERRRDINMSAAARATFVSDRLDEQDIAVLRQYSGNGGCGDSLNEFYTDPKVAAAMWAVLHDLGVGQGAQVLEPSCATGVFMETAPSGVRMTGVEMDPMSSKIATLLHPAAEIKNSSLERFATSDDRQFDAVIGNAPFGLRGSLLKDDKRDLSTAEGYFLDTSLDKTRAGGIVAMIVPTGVLDSKRDRKLRERLLRKGEFLGALRMPNTAFEAAHTGVTTDVVFFRKRPDEVAGALMAVDQATLKKLGVWDEDYLAGAYFTERGAANILGTMTEGWRAKAGMGDDITVEGSMVGVPAAIAEFKPESVTPSQIGVADILAACPDEDMREKARGGAASRPYTAKVGDTKMIDGVEYILEGKPPRWHRVDEYMADKAVTDAQEIAAAIEGSMGGDPPEGLADRVRAYIATYGLPSKNPNLMIAAGKDKTLYRLLGAIKPDGSLSDLVEGRKAVVQESSFDAAAQSLALETGAFTPEQVAGRWASGDADTVLDHLYASPDYALDPVTGLWTSTDQYLSGDMWPKLDAAQAALAGEIAKPEDRAKFDRQAKLLEEAIDPKSLEDVECTLASDFIPLDVRAAFFNRNIGNEDGRYAPLPLVLTYDCGVYAVQGGHYDAKLLDKYLNRTGVKQDDEWPTINKWNAEFHEWLCSSPYREQVEDTYNRTFRGFRQREYSDAAFEIPGLNPDGLKPHIYSGIRAALESGKSILADDVGLGKTVQGLILARMAKVTGKARKPMIIVPKSVLANWVAEAEKWFPGSNVLTIGETYTRDKNGVLKGRQDDAAERNRKYHDLTQNDYDFILISQPAWNDLDLDPVTKGEYVNEDFWVQRGDSLGNAGDKRTNKIREAYDQAMAKREFKSRTDAIYFNDLGVDMLIGDEMHAYKNLYAAKNRFGQSPKFLGGSGLSNRALDMALKTRWLREQNDGKNVYGLTATPTKNSPLEIYSMLTHIAPEAFERIGIKNSEQFLDRFCEFETRNILSTTGQIEEAVCVVGFKNMDELRSIMKRYINRRTAEQVGLKLPARDDRQHLVDMTAEQKEVYAFLRAKAEEAKSKDATGDAHIFSIMNKMGKAAMDLEMYDPTAYPGAHSPKYAAAATEIVAGAADGGQVVFADNIAVHDKMMAALIAGGIPREQIGVINAQVAESSSKRQNVSDAFNSGKLKVVIGNTATMGEGINLQKGTTDIHHLDLPWEPASMQQRNGRGLRQGNMSTAVRIHSYMAKGSFDGYRYQTLMAKKDWQDELWNGGDRVSNLALEGALSRDDMMCMLAEDPDAAREQLATNKAAAMEKFAAAKNTEAAEMFGRYDSMRRSIAAMKKADRAKPAAQRLKVKMDRLKLSLSQNEHFKAKAALDSKAPVMIQPQTGDAYTAGTAFETEGGGKWVTLGVVHDATAGAMVKARRYGVAAAGITQVPLSDLAHAKTFEYDEKGEQAAIAAHFAAANTAGVNGIKTYADLHNVPSSVLQASYDTVQKQIKDGMKDYTFSRGGYAEGTAFVKDGKAVLSPGYGDAEYLKDHDVMIPTDEHRKLATEAYIENESKKTFARVSVGKGRNASEIISARYPGYGSSNRWGGTGDVHFGAGFMTTAHAEFESRQYAKARREKTLTATMAALIPTAHTKYGMTPPTMPKKALAIIWARAKRLGKLDAPMLHDVPSEGGGTDVFSTGQGGYAGQIGQRSVKDVLIAKASDDYPDLAAAMIVAGGASGILAIQELMKLRTSQGVASAIGHIIAKDPALGERKASEFAPIGPAKSGYSYGSSGTPAHPLYTRFGERSMSMTLAELADSMTTRDDEDTRDAA